jgi:ribosome-binding protein aMBF1 (putative translation factor)
MSVHTKGRHIRVSYIKVSIGNGNKTLNYKIPNKGNIKNKLTELLQPWKESEEDFLTPWEEATPWENVAADRLAKYKKAGLVLRGARYREGISQKELARRCNISQDNLSKIENGKRVVGEKVAKRLAEALHFDYRLLLEN